MDKQVCYRCADAAGGTYVFTVNRAERRSDLLVRHIDDLRVTMKSVKNRFHLLVWWCYPSSVVPASYYDFKIDYETLDKRSR